MSEDLNLLNIVLDKVINLNKEASRLREPQFRFFSFGSFSSFFKTIFNYTKTDHIRSDELVSIINSVYNKNTDNYLNFETEIDRLHRLWYNIIISTSESPVEVYDKIKERLLTFSSEFLNNALNHTIIDIENWYSPNGNGAQKCIKNLKENAKLFCNNIDGC